MKTLWNILSYIILFLKLEYSNCQCTFPDLWLDEADTNPISDLNLTFREGNKAAVVSFNENNKAGDILTLYYDGDKGPPTFIATSMQAGNCSEGKCTISVPMLDFEINQTPLVIAICPLESVTVTVDLQDVNDNEPFFTSSPSRMNYPENEEGIIERQICGSDLDKADVPILMCSLLINEIPSQNFLMVPGQNSNGNEKCFQIEVFKALDFEEQTTYLLEIVLSDNLFNASTYVPLIVEDRPDQPPQWSRFPSIISFPENTQVGHVIAVFLAIDGDHGINQPIRYELREGNENIDLCPQTGNLTLVKQIDRDVNGAKSYVLEFEIFAIEDDFSSEGITGDVLMTVTDVNDNIPTFSYPGPYTVWVPEGTAGTIIFNHFIEVTDRDFGINGSYSAEIIIEDLDVATEKLQIINTLTGTPKGSQVTNYSIICIDKNFLDYKFETEINFKVKVTEDADISHFSEANFTITLEEINDKVDVDDEQLYMVLFYVTATILVIIVIAITAMYIMKVRRHEREVRALMTAQRGIQDLSLSKTGSTPPSTNTFREGTNPVLSVDEEKVLPDNTNNDHQGFDISVHQSTSPVPETAGQLYGASGSNPNRIDSSIHAKAKNQSHAGAADENRPKNGVRLTISTLNDETFLGIGANKLGVTIETEA